MALDTVFFYTLIMLVAFALLGIICSPKSKKEISTKIVEMAVEPTNGSTESIVTFKALPKGLISVKRSNFMLHPGDTVCLVIHKYTDHIKIVEKKGLVGMGEEVLCCGETTIGCIGQRWYSYRYESEVTGQWCKFEFTNLDGNEAKAELRI